MRTVVAVLILASGCADSSDAGPWLAEGVDRYETGTLRQASCEDIATDRVRIRVGALYDLVPAAIDDEAYFDASFEVHPSILDGRTHDIRGWIDLPSDLLREPDAEGIVFTPEEGHDPAIHHAVAILWTAWETPAAGRFHLTGTIRLRDPCPTGSMQILAAGDTVPYRRMEAFMPLEPQARP